MPNPWDAGAAKVLEALGFNALATTSSGFAFTFGRPDGGVTLSELSEHVARVAESTNLPVSVDLEDGFGPEPEAAASAVEAAARSGAVGGSIEDWDSSEGIYPLDQAVARVSAAVEAAASLDIPFTLTARAENLIRGRHDLADTITRLQAYEQAGADVLFAPGLRGAGQVSEVCRAVNRPLNVLAYPTVTVRELADAGAQRISVGGALTWTAVEAMASAAERIRDQGDFSLLASSSRIQEWLAR